MSFTMRNKSEFSRHQLTRFDAIDDEPAATGCDDVKHQAVLERRKHETPRRSELRAGVERTTHTEEMKHLANAIHRCPNIRHQLKVCA